MQIRRPWVRSGRTGICLTLRINSTSLCLTPRPPPPRPPPPPPPNPTFVCTGRTQICAHVNDPISVCRKRVGFTASGMVTQKYCINNNNESLLYSAILLCKLLDSLRCSTTRNLQSFNLSSTLDDPPSHPHPYPLPYKHIYTPVTIVPVQKSSYSPHYPAIGLH